MPHPRLQVLGARSSPAREMEDKLGRLRRLLRGKGSVLVAFSGGVDSSLLARVAHEELGGRCVAVLAVSPTLSAFERAEARRTARQIGVAFEEVAHNEFDNQQWADNRADRCGHCKRDLTLRLAPLARQRGLAAVAYGVVTDDLDDVRPGVAASLEEGAWHPLVEAGLSKADVREAARLLGVPTWDKPAAPCLSSRIPHGEPITLEKLHRVEAAEAAMRRLGFAELRVRSHGSLARVEVPSGRIEEAAAHASRIVEALRAAGFTFVTLDLAGFRSGSLHEGPPSPGGP